MKALKMAQGQLVEKLEKESGRKRIGQKKEILGRDGWIEK